MQDHVDKLIIENLVMHIEINSIRVGSFVKMVVRKDMYYDTIGKDVVTMSDYFILVINMFFGRENEIGIYMYVPHQKDEIWLVVT